MTLLLYRIETMRDGCWETLKIFRPEYNEIPASVKRRKWLIFTVEVTEAEILNEDEAVYDCQTRLEAFVRRYGKTIPKLRVRATYRNGNKLKTKVVWTRKGEHGDDQYYPQLRD